jgi:hypothetical protein
VAAQTAEVAAGEGGQLVAIESDAPGRRPLELQDAAGERGLAAAALADDADGLARAQVERHAVHRGQLAAGERAAGDTVRLRERLDRE